MPSGTRGFQGSGGGVWDVTKIESPGNWALPMGGLQRGIFATWGIGRCGGLMVLNEEPSPLIVASRWGGGVCRPAELGYNNGRFSALEEEVPRDIFELGVVQTCFWRQDGAETAYF